MLRGLVACIALVEIVAVRRSSAGEPEAIHSIMSSQQHDGRSVAQRSLAMARALAEIDATTAWTGGVKGNLSDVVLKMQEDVVKKIEMGHDETQKRLDADVLNVGTKAGKADISKSAANQADKLLQVCIEQEKQALQDTVAAENAYNVRTAETVEPCQREIDTATFSSTSGGPVTIKCDTGTDPQCAQAKAALARQLADLQTKMFGELDVSAGNHKTAENDCQKAVKAQTDQLAAVKDDQSVWVTKHGECAGLEVQRDTKICHFGEKIQEVCDAKADYDALVSSTQTSGNTNSVSDRVSEWKVTQLVVCLLDKFQRGTNLNDQSVEECENSISTNKFDLMLKSDEVQSILDVPTSPTFQIACKDSEAINFHGGVWNVPSGVPNTRRGYDGQVPSEENKTLAMYQFAPSWSLAVSLSAQTPPFTLAECTAAPVDDPTDSGPEDADDAGDGKGSGPEDADDAGDGKGPM